MFSLNALMQYLIKVNSMKVQKNNIDCITNNSEKATQEVNNALSCTEYLRQARIVITEALKNGCDVVQMPNGEIIIREQKTVTTKFNWHKEKEKIVKLSTEIENPSNHCLNL